MIRNSYCFVGLPFSGKSYLGRCISFNKNKGFIDTDNMIKYKYNKDLKDIIKEKGDKEFINIENKILSSLSFENTIVSPGGSAIYSNVGMEHLKTNLNCEIIHLYLPFEEFKKRATDLEKRGVINPSNLDLKSLYDERINLCNYYSDITLYAQNKNNIYKELKIILD
tara:strand:- start:4069 stop:4569 length:501 start_codon:yes stop_codon:yes gene_type:complete